MRLMIMLIGAAALWVICVGATRFFLGTSRDATRSGSVVFLVFWILIALTNLVIGVTQTGYSLMEELPFFLVIVGLPAAIAWLVRGKFFDR